MIAVLLLAAALLALPQEAPSAAAVPPTRLGRLIVERRPLVVLARTARAMPFGIGTAVVTVQVERVLLGDGPRAGEELVLFAYAGDLREGGRDLLLLQPFGRGGRWAILERVDGRDPDFIPKLRVTEATVALASLEDGPSRDAATFDLLVRLAARDDAWSRAYAVRELAWAARTHPALFTQLRRRRLGLLRDSPDPIVRAGVESVTAMLASPADALPERAHEESSPP